MPLGIGKKSLPPEAYMVAAVPAHEKAGAVASTGFFVALKRREGPVGSRLALARTGAPAVPVALQG
jgi:hypothetical protein